MNMSNATAQVASDLLNAQAILSDTTATRSAVEREYLKPYWKLERSLFLKAINKTINFGVFSHRPHHSQIQETLMRPSNNFEN